MKSYKQKFQEKLDEEISEFRQKVKAQPAQEIYEDCSRIHFYECMYDYLNTEEFKTSEYKAFLQADNTFIENLWYKSLDFEFFNIGNPIDESLVVDAYLRDCAAEPVPHCM